MMRMDSLGKFWEKTKKRLKELGFERVWLSKKSWYWRKRNYKFGEIIDFGDVLE